MDMHFEGVIFQTHAAELRRRMGRSSPAHCVVDVRSSARFAAGHVPGSISASPADLERGLPPGTDVGTEFLLLGDDPRDPLVRKASLALRRRGVRRCVEVPGGILEWRQMGYPLESTPASTVAA